MLGWLVRKREVRSHTIIIHSSFEDSHTCRYHKLYHQSDLNLAGRAECNWFEFDRLGFKLTDRGNPPSSRHKTQTQYATETINISFIKVM